MINLKFFFKSYLEKEVKYGSHRSQTPLHVTGLINLIWEICNVCWSWLVLFPGQCSGVLGASYPDLGSLRLAMGGVPRSALYLFSLTFIEDRISIIKLETV